MTSRNQRYGAPSPGRGRGIVVAAIATAGGLVALFSYHTSPGGLAALTSGFVSADPTTEPTTAPLAAGAADTDGDNQGGDQDGDGDATTQQKATSAPSAKASSAAAKAPAKKSYTGKAANTRWGTVQVKITVQDGKIVSASAPESPHGTQHSIEINQRAIPILNEETVKAGSAQIDSVSGATVTSGGYMKSLQSAVDMAHL